MFVPDGFRFGNGFSAFQGGFEETDGLPCAAQKGSGGNEVGLRGDEASRFAENE